MAGHDDRVVALIKGCIKEDRLSQKELYRHFYAFSIGICLRYANNRADAEAIVNEGFFKIFTSIQKYDFSKPFVAWLSRVMSNTAIDHYRANLRFSHHDDITEQEFATPYNAVYDKLNYQDLLALVQRLTPAYRTVFNMFAIEGYSHEEIAAKLNISVGTSKSNLFKARSKLMQWLNQMDGQGNRPGLPPAILGDNDYND